MPIHIHATKKLATKLPLDSLGFIAAPSNSLRAIPSVSDRPNPLSHWQANLITLQRHNCVLLVHNATRFPVVIMGLKKPDYQHFDRLFQHTFVNTLLKSGASEAQMDRATQLLQDACFDTITDRSVMGTLNRMAGDIEHLLWVDQAQIENVSEYKLGSWLADMVCGINKQKDWIQPNQAMAALLESN